MRLLALTIFLGVLACTACGPYTPEDGERDAVRIASIDDCTPTSDDGLTPLPVITRSDASVETSIATLASGKCVSPSPSPELTPADPPAELDTATPELQATIEPTIVLTPTPAPPTPTPSDPTSDPTAAAATATARAMRSVAYLSFGDGIQWGCCGFLSQSASSLFSDYLQQRIGRPVIWQTSGAGYETTDTFLFGINGAAPQIDFAVELLAYYQREQIPIAAITMSIGGNNLVELGRACAQPPCTDAFIAAVAHLREQLHLIYGRIAAAKDASTPLLVLLYYDANECTNPVCGYGSARSSSSRQMPRSCFFLAWNSSSVMIPCTFNWLSFSSSTM